MRNNTSSHNLQTIVSLCDSIAKSGATPTVALIKKHAIMPLPLPEIISVLKNWKEDPNQFLNLQEMNDQLDSSQPKSADEKIAGLEERVSNLEKQVASLLKLLE